MKQCDIIIPIYNAYDCLAPCIDSVLKCTNMEENRIILINDKSTDERVLPLLKTYENGKNIILLENEENLGFVGTVNRGMKYSKSDVLLLNSDTEVTDNWLDKMKQCAYQDEMVATVTPLSNNATLASVPMMFIKNELPEGYTLEQMGKLVEDCSLNSYPELPTGHGFCLYIKREVLDKVGFFDDVAFKKGYGEENDFCFRCFDRGYRHLLCDNTYVYHKESQSFSEAKIELMKNGEKVLSDRYPEYKSRLSEWCNQRPLDYIGANIAYSLNKDKKKTNVLYLVHDFENFMTNNGGTTLHCWDLIRNLRSEYNFFVLSYSAGMYKLTSIYENAVSEYKIGSVHNFNKYTFYNNEYEEILEEIVEKYSINLIHIHHMQFHYFNIIDIIKKYDIPTVLSLHDCYSACPLIMKMFNFKTYCGNPTESKCGECLKLTKSINQNFISEWRQNYINLFNVCKKVVVPHEAAKNELLKTFNRINNLVVIEHGEDLEKEYSELTINDKEITDIAFVGAIGIHKGRNILIDLVKNSRKLKKVRIHLFGIVDNFNEKNNPRYINHGRYNREELNGLLKENNIKLVCILSLCPETYSYTLTETIAAGIPVLGVDLGAIGLRIKESNLGWTIKHDADIKDYINKINSIISDSAKYNKIIKNINNYKIKTTKEMAKDYSKIYKSYKKESLISKDIIKHIKDSRKYICQPVNANYSWIFNTLKWKLFTKLKFPKFAKIIYRKMRRK